MPALGGAKARHFHTPTVVAFISYRLKHFYNLTGFLLFLSLSSASEVFCDSQRNILKENDIVRFPKLAETYQRIAEEGPDVFYNGSMAQSIVEDIQAAGVV